jgi:hypothetical protein
MIEPRSAAIDLVLTRVSNGVTAALVALELPAPAYAVGLWGNGLEDLAPGVVCVGLEPDRVAAVNAPARERPWRWIWNVSEYAIDARLDPDPEDDAAFVEAQAEALETLYGAGVSDPQQWVLNRVARTVGTQPPLVKTTDDFVVFAFVEGFGAELAQNLRFSAGRAFDLLQRRKLVPPS